MSSIHACIAGSRFVSIESDAPWPRRSNVIKRPQAVNRRRPRDNRIVAEQIDRRRRSRRIQNVAPDTIRYLILP